MEPGVRGKCIISLTGKRSSIKKYGSIAEMPFRGKPEWSILPDTTPTKVIKAVQMNQIGLF